MRGICQEEISFVVNRVGNIAEMDKILDKVPKFQKRIQKREVTSLEIKTEITGKEPLFVVGLVIVLQKFKLMLFSPTGIC